MLKEHIIDVYDESSISMCNLCTISLKYSKLFWISVLSNLLLSVCHCPLLESVILNLGSGKNFSRESIFAVISFGKSANFDIVIAAKVR